MVNPVSAIDEALKPAVFLPMLSELHSAIQKYSDPSTSKTASAEAANSAMLAVRKIINSCQSFNTAGDFLKFLHDCEKSLGINNNSYLAIQPFSGNVRDTREYLVLLNQWLAHHGLKSLDVLSNKIDRPTRTDAAARERMNNIKTLLSQCRYDSSAQFLFSANLPNHNNEGLVYVRENFDSRYQLQKQWYHDNISCGGTEKQRDNLKKVKELSTGLVQNFIAALDPDAKGSIVNTLAGSNDSTDPMDVALPDDSLLQQTKKLKSYNPEFKGPFDINQNINLWFTKISSSAIALFWQKIMRGSALLLNKGFGLFENVNILDSIASIGRKGDEAYQNVKELQNKATTAADALHKMLDTAGVIVSNLDKCDLEQHLAAGRMIADAIENATNISGVTIDRNTFIENIKLSHNQPGYRAYFVLHLMNAVRYEPLKKKCEQLLPHMVSNGLDDMRDLLMPKDASGNRKPPSLFAMLNVLKESTVANLSEATGKLGNFASLLNTPDLKGQIELLSKTFFQNSILSPLYHVIQKLGWTVEELEHPDTLNFAAKRVQSGVRSFWLEKVVPVVTVICDPIVSLWNLPKRLPLVNFITGMPFRIVEGVHGFAGSVVGIVPFIGKYLKKTWEILTPAGILSETIKTKGTNHSLQAAQLLLNSITTPFLDLRSQLEQIAKNVSSPANMHLIVAASQNLRNVVNVLAPFLMEQAKAERCNVMMPEAVFKRLGIPLNGKSPTIETFVNNFRDLIRTNYNSLYGAEGAFTNAYTPPKVTDANPFGNRNAPFGIQYLDSSGKTVIDFSDQYFDHETGVMLQPNQAKQRNEIEFEKLKSDMKDSHFQLESELQIMMKTGVLSYIDSISPAVSAFQETTSHVKSGEMSSPNLNLGSGIVRPTPPNVARLKNAFLKYTEVAKDIAGTTFTCRSPIAFSNNWAEQLCH